MWTPSWSFFLQPFCPEWIYQYGVKSQQLTGFLCLAVDRAAEGSVYWICCFDRYLHLWLPLAGVYQCFSDVCCCLEATDFTLKVTGSVVSSFPGHSFKADSVQYMTSHTSPDDLAISQQASTSPCWNKQRRPAPKHSICWTCWFFQLGWKVLSVGWVLECGLMMWTGPGNWRKQLTAKNVHLNKSFL